MKLNRSSLADTAAWSAAGIALPRFDLDAVAARTREHPVWVHFGAGNIFRAFPAAVLQGMLDSGAADTGVIVAEGYDYEIVDELAAHDNLSLLVTLKADGTIDKTVIGSITESLKVDSAGGDWARQCEIFRAPSLQMVSFTITEKGYSVPNEINDDLNAPVSYIGKLAALLYERFRAGGVPLALVSMDNCSHNGDKVRAAVFAYADAWVMNGAAEAGFMDYINERVSYPWTMIDKITPRPDDDVKRMLAARGFEDTAGTVTAKRTYIAPFVNAEETEWLVVEDDFPNGRPMLEKGGVIFTDRDTVDRVEKMKVCTCLNPLHTALAIFGCLLGYTKISDEMKDADLVRLIETVGYTEGLPVVVNPGILDPREFIDNVVGVRLPNPFMPDTPQRIACDTSQKLPIRFGETLKAYLADPALDTSSLRAIPLVLAGWLRYLRGVDDNGHMFELSPDPRLDELHERVETDPRGIIADASLFGVNLYDAGIGERVEALYYEMCATVGAVRVALGKV